MVQISESRDILFGLFAVQGNLITIEQLQDGYREWITQKSTPVSELFKTQGVLSAEQCRQIDARIDSHLRQLDGGVGPNTMEFERSMTVSLQEFVDDSDFQHFLVTHNIDIASDRPLSLSDGVGQSSATGRFRILRPHAKGGLGEVFVAHDEELDREVALKQIQVIRADNVEQRDRFLREAEITGKLEHPGIVPVYGLGHDEQGRPFYVMRFIRGKSLRDAIEQFHEKGDARSDPSERNRELRRLLGWFIDVCEAIAYAHSRGVLHRDLKPGNIMLGRYGETLVVDWGLARTSEKDGSEIKEQDETLVKAKLGSGSSETIAGRAMGTPAYMSPEQAEGRLDVLGARSDVYSLGATLYSILTGGAPVTGSDAVEVLQNVSSGKISSPRSVDSTVPVPLDAICRKAMSVKPEDRYETPLELAADIEAWMADAPVSACSDPLSVRLRRWARRHQTGVAAACAGVIMLAASATVAAILLQDKNSELRNANSTINDQNLQLAQTNEDLEQANIVANNETEKARVKAMTSQNVTDFLVGLFEVADRSAHRGNTITAREVLDFGANRINNDLKEEPKVQATLMSTMGLVYQNLALYEQADPLLQQSLEIRRQTLGENHVDVADSYFRLAELRHYQDKFAEAEAGYQKTLDRLRQIHGDDHEDIARTLDLLGRSKRDQSDYDAAEALAQESLEMRKRLFGDEHTEITESLQSLSMLAYGRGDTESAIRYSEQALEMRRRLLGPEHPDIPELIHGLGVNQMNSNPEKAEKLIREALTLSRKLFGDLHRNVAHGTSQLAVILNDRGELDEAEKLYLESLEAYRKLVGDESFDVALTLNNLGTLERDRKDYDAAEKYMRQAMEIQIQILGEDHIGTSLSYYNIGYVRKMKADYEESEKLFLKAFAIRNDVLGIENPYTVKVIKALVDLYEAWDKPGQAEEWKLKIKTEENKN